MIEQYGWDDGSYELGNNRKIWDSPFYLGLSGGYWYGMLGNVGDFVDSWSSVVDDDEDAYYLNTDSYGYVYLDANDFRINGYVVRCAVR